MKWFNDEIFNMSDELTEVKYSFFIKEFCIRK